MKSKGFTLMELIVSLSIMTLIIAMVLPAYTSIMSSRDIMDKGGLREMREAQALMSLMRADLKSAFLSNRSGEEKFIMVDAVDLDGNAKDEIYFTSFSNYIPEGASNISDQCEVGYYLRENDETKTLYRKSDKIIDEDITYGGEEVKLTDSIEYFDVMTYKDATSAEIVFGGKADDKKTLPRAIVIKIGMKRDDGRVDAYETAFVLPHYIAKPESKDGEGEEKKEGEDKNKDKNDEGEEREEG